MKLRLAALFAFSLTAILAANAQTSPSDRVDDYVRSQLVEQHIPGIALGVYQDGKIIKAGDFDLCWRTPDMKSAPLDVTEPFIMTLAGRGEYLAVLDAALARARAGAPSPWSRR